MIKSKNIFKGFLVGLSILSAFVYYDIFYYDRHISLKKINESIVEIGHLAKKVTEIVHIFEKHESEPEQVKRDLLKYHKEGIHLSTSLLVGLEKENKENIRQLYINGLKYTNGLDKYFLLFDILDDSRSGKKFFSKDEISTFESELNKLRMDPNQLPYHYENVSKSIIISIF